MIEEYFTKAWEAYRKNALSFALGILITIGVPTILMFIGAFASGFSIAGSLSTLNPATILTGSAIFIVFSIIGILVAIVLYAGLIKMSAEAIKGKTNLSTLFSTASQKAVPVIIASIIVGIILGIISLILLSVFGGFGLLAGGFFGAIGLSMIGMLITYLIGLLFIFTIHGVVLNNLGAMEAIKNSANIAKANYLTLLVILIGYTIILFLLSIIPVLGIILGFGVIYPMLIIALTSLYLNARKR